MRRLPPGKRLAGLAVAAGLVLALALAATGVAAPRAKAPAVAPFPTQNMTITVWDTSEPTKLALYQNTIIPAYEKLHPNITIDYQQYPTGDLVSKEAVALSSGQGPTIFSVQGNNLLAMWAANFLAPAQDSYWKGGVQSIVSKYIKGSLHQVMPKGKLYALPNQQNSWSLFINKDEFKAAGLDPVKDAPKTWDDVAKLEKKLTIYKDGKLVQKGFDWRYTAGTQWTSWAFTLLNYQNGGSVINSDKPTFDGPAGLKALQTWMKAVSPAPDVTSNTGALPYADFASGQDAMSFGGPNAGAVFETINPAIKGHYTVAPMPQVNLKKPVNFYYSFNLAVNSKASSDEQRVAWDFITYALRDPMMWWDASKMMQPRLNAYDNADARATVGMPVFVHDLTIAKPTPATLHWPQFADIINSMIQNVVFNHTDPKQALDAAGAQFKQAVG